MSLKYKPTNYERISGSQVLLDYGRVIVKYTDGHRWHSREENAENTKHGQEIREQQSKLQFYFEVTNKNAILKKYISDKGSDTVNIMQATCLAYLSCRLMDGDENILLSVVANAVSRCVVDCSELEARNYIANALIHGNGAFLVCDDRDNGKSPRIFLSESYVTDFFGRDVALLTPAIILERQLEVIKKTSKKFRNINPKQITGNCSIKDFIRGLPVLTPQELYDEVGRRGYVGQSNARRAVCLSVYRFISRLRKIHLEGMKPNEIPQVGNILIRGFTGVGKSYLLKTLTEATGIPSIIEDITRYSETGYVGEDVSALLSKVYQRCNSNIEIAQACSIIAIDEIDKISNPRIGNTLVSRDGVSRSLLKLIEGTILEIPVDPGDHPFRSRRVRFDTSRLLWVGIGCFDGWESIVGRISPLGFGAETGEQVGSSSDYARYGFGSELLGRFGGGIVNLDPLTHIEMKNILINTLPKYQRECQVAGIEFSVNDSLLDSLVDSSLARKTGARGLVASLETHLNDLLYNAYSNKGQKKIELAVDGEVMGELDEKMAG